MRLTYGEVLWLTRRRASATMTQMARYLHISEDRLRRWEKGREAIPHGVDAVLLAVRPTHLSERLCRHATEPLSVAEVCQLMRRRCGWTLDELAHIMGLSRITVFHMEHGMWDPARLLSFWQGNGWTEPVSMATLPLAIGPDWPHDVEKPR